MFVAALADTEQVGLAAGAVLTWHQPERGGEVPAASVLLAVAHLRCEHARLTGPTPGFGLRRDEPHGRACRRLADRLGVDEVVLVTLDEGPYEVRRDELDLVPEGGEFAGPGAGFHDHRAGVQRGEALDQLLAAYLLAKHCLSGLVLAVKVKYVLTQINSDQRDVFHGTPPRRNFLQRTPLQGGGDHLITRFAESLQAPLHVIESSHVLSSSALTGQRCV